MSQTLTLETSEVKFTTLGCVGVTPISKSCTVLLSAARGRGIAWTVQNKSTISLSLYYMPSKFGYVHSLLIMINGQKYSSLLYPGWLYTHVCAHGHILFSSKWFIYLCLHRQSSYQVIIIYTVDFNSFYYGARLNQ